MQGIPVCFDAKECAASTFPLQNLHPHQVAFMREFEQQGGVSFILVSYTGLEEMYYVPFRHVEKFWRRMEEGGRKASPTTRWNKAFRVRAFREFFVHYLEAMQRDLELREDKIFWKINGKHDITEEVNCQ